MYSIQFKNLKQRQKIWLILDKKKQFENTSRHWKWIVELIRNEKLQRCRKSFPLFVYAGKKKTLVFIIYRFINLISDWNSVQSSKVLFRFWSLLCSTCLTVASTERWLLSPVGSFCRSSLWVSFTFDSKQLKRAAHSLAWESCRSPQNCPRSILRKSSRKRLRLLTELLCELILGPAPNQCERRTRSHSRELECGLAEERVRDEYRTLASEAAVGSDWLTNVKPMLEA